MCNCGNNFLYVKCNPCSNCGGYNNGQLPTQVLEVKLPPGGTDNQVLAKAGDALVWRDISEQGGIPQDIIIPITSNDQILFLNVIPTGKTLTNLYIDGVKQIKNVDYTITNSNLNWTSTDFDLNTSLILTITIF